jgi:protein TonB
MNAITADPGLDPFRRRRRKRQPAWLTWTILGVVVVLVASVVWLRGPTISDHDRARKIINVVLPPPPPPPPPPEVQPDETPPEPKPAPIEQPQDVTPPPPTPQDAAPTQGTDALTAREGAGPSNYGLQRGDGGGTRIGGTPGGAGNGFAAYAERARSEIYRATTSNPALQGRFRIPEVRVWVDADGQITRAEVATGSGDRRRDTALERALVGLRLSQRPPPGLPFMRLEFARSGA